MAKWIIGTLVFFLPLLPLTSPKRHVVRVAGRWVDLGSVLAEATVTSADECVALCNVTRGCGASVLLSNRCVLHRKHCRCPHDALRPNASMSSCYVIRRQPEKYVDCWQAAHDDCEALGMYLVAIDSAAEQSYIADQLQLHAPDCFRTYTSGYTPRPGGYNPADFRWQVTPYHSQPVTFTHWMDEQPDNKDGRAQDVIALISSYDYRWNDVRRIASESSPQYCHVCECNTCY